MKLCLGDGQFDTAAMLLTIMGASCPDEPSRAKRYWNEAAGLADMYGNPEMAKRLRKEMDKL